MLFTTLAGLADVSRALHRCWKWPSLQLWQTEFRARAVFSECCLHENAVYTTVNLLQHAEKSYHEETIAVSKNLLQLINSWKLRYQRKILWPQATENIELMVSHNSGAYRSERNWKSFEGNVCHAKVLNCLSILKVSLISVRVHKCASWILWKNEINFKSH